MSITTSSTKALSLPANSSWREAKIQCEGLPVGVDREQREEVKQAHCILASGKHYYASFSPRPRGPEVSRHRLPIPCTASARPLQAPLWNSTSPWADRHPLFLDCITLSQEGGFAGGPRHPLQGEWGPPSLAFCSLDLRGHPCSLKSGFSLWPPRTDVFYYIRSGKVAVCVLNVEDPRPCTQRLRDREDITGP